MAIFLIPTVWKIYLPFGAYGRRNRKGAVKVTGIAFSYVYKTNWLVGVDFKKYTSPILFFNEKLAEQEKTKIGSRPAT